MDVLVNYPGMGSLWLIDAEWVDTPDGRYVVGDAEDNSIPEGFSTMNFPESCVRKIVGAQQLGGEGDGK